MSTGSLFNISSWFAPPDGTTFTIQDKGVYSTNSIPEVCGSVRKAIENDSNEQELVAALMVVLDICHQPEASKLKEKLGQSGIVESLVEIFVLKGSNIEIMELSAEVCSLLAEIDTNRTRIIDCNIISAMVLLANASMTDGLVCTWCCKFIKNMTTESATVNKLITLGACEVVASVVEKHMSNEDALESACRAIYALCKTSKRCKDKFGGTLVMNVIVTHVFQKIIQAHAEFTDDNGALLASSSVMDASCIDRDRDNSSPIDTARYSGSPTSSYFPTRRGVDAMIVSAEWGLRVIGILVQKHTENSARAKEVNMGILVLDLFKIYSDEDEQFISSLLFAIQNLADSDDTHQTLFVEHGMCDLTLSTMAKYTEKLCVLAVSDCYRVLRILAFNNANTQQILVDKGAAVQILQSMQKFRGNSHDIVQWGWYVLDVLATNRSNLGSIAACGGCQENVNALKRFVVPVLFATAGVCYMM